MVIFLVMIKILSIEVIKKIIFKYLKEFYIIETKDIIFDIVVCNKYATDE